MRAAAIADDLRARIIRGDFPDARIPSHRVLAGQYETTLSTLRSALSVLADEGWVHIEHGVGTFARDPRDDLDVLASLQDTNEGAIHTTVTDVVTVVSDRPPPSLAVPAVGRAIRVDRVRHVDATPAVHQSSYLSGAHAAVLAGLDGSESLYHHVARTTGRVATGARESVHAVAAPAAVASALELSVGEPILRSVRVARDQHDDVLVVDVAHVDANRLRLHIDHRGRQAVTSYVASDWDADLAGTP